MMPPEHRCQEVVMPETSIHAKVGASVARIRTERGMSQRGLAVRMGLAQSQLSRLEGGDVPWKLDQLETAAEELGVPLEMLLPGARPVQLGTLLTDDESALIAAVRRRDDIGAVRAVMDILRPKA
jgi:transcriptional regulator with XRE-family HTH domain